MLNRSGKVAARTLYSLAVAAATCVVLAAVAGCSPTPKTTRLTSPYHQTVTIAVAPALNFSGSLQFDPVVVADLLASELSHVDDVVVVPVSRVLAVLAGQGRRQIESPSHALEVCESLGAQAIVVMAITEYDPYDPPVVGIAAQLYALSGESGSQLDAVAAGRRASPFAIEAAVDSPLRPRAQSQRVYNASHDVVAETVRRYARDRGADNSPLGWRKYIKSQQLFLRFCCWATVRELMRQEWHRQTGQTVS